MSVYFDIARSFVKNAHQIIKDIDDTLELHAEQGFNESKTQNKNRPRIISIEGNIGAGKSTLLENLEKHLANSGWIFMREPLHLWDEIRDADGCTILKKFYGDQKKYSFAFQIMSYTTRLQELKRLLKENPRCKGIICERSPDADRNIFTKMLHSDGCIEDVEFEIYNRYFQVGREDFEIDSIIYWCVPPEICMQRIQKRSRDGEGGIPLAYLGKCHAFHSMWLDHTETPILYLNGDVDVKSEEYGQRLQQIEQFLEKGESV
jgi:deoxyadenosine/deoxycytidine kinase